MEMSSKLLKKEKEKKKVHEESFIYFQPNVLTSFFMVPLRKLYTTFFPKVIIYEPITNNILTHQYSECLAKMLQFR